MCVGVWGCLCVLGRALQQFETFHDGEIVKLHQFEVMQIANLMQADSEVEEVSCPLPSDGWKAFF